MKKYLSGLLKNTALVSAGIAIGTAATIALYKLEDVLKALGMGAVELLIIIEDIELKIEGMDAIEYLEEKAQNYGTNITLVSRHTREGVQFRHFGGVGAILRYRIN